MPQPKILRAKDVAEELKISESTAYKLIKQLNKELSAKGYITFAGRVSSNAPTRMITANTSAISFAGCMVFRGFFAQK